MTGSRRPEPSRPLLTPSQCRAARVHLRLSEEDAARMAGIPLGVFRAFEAGERRLRWSDLLTLREALAAGAEIAGEDGCGPGAQTRTDRRG